MKRLILLLLVLALALASSALAEGIGQAEPLKIILDCDMGYMNDDALALSMLLKLEEAGRVELLGITLTGGNTFIRASYTNQYGDVKGSYSYLTEFLENAGRTDIPVYEGIDRPKGCIDCASYGDSYRYYIDVNNEIQSRVILNDSFGAMWQLRDFKGEFTESDAAADFMIACASAYPDEIIIVALGPACNIARAAEKNSEFAENISAVYMMGGAFGEMSAAVDVEGEEVVAVPGANTTNYGEYNASFDPKALEVLLKAGFKKLVLSPGSCAFDVPENLGQLLSTASDNPNALLKLWIDYHNSVLQDYPYWDPMVVYALIEPEKTVKSQSGYVTVDANANSPEYCMTKIISEEVYEALPDSEKSAYTYATVLEEMADFYDYLIPLLAADSLDSQD